MTREQALEHAATFRAHLYDRLNLSFEERKADKRSCKELVANLVWEHKPNQLLIMASEVIDDLVLALQGPAS
jgi:hypothetical protein